MFHVRIAHRSPHKRRQRLIGTMLLVIGLCLAWCEGVRAQDGRQRLFPEVRQGPLSPQQSLERIKVAPGLRVELVAAEPQVADPVAIAFDEQGKLWVVELADYPDGPPPGQPPLSRVRMLEDRDGDGHYESSRIFAHSILFPNGILPWRGGVIVTAAPYIYYLKDTDGDGRADLQQKLFEGFAAMNPQLRVNHPTLGLDNWIYVANGLRGGTVQPLATGTGKTAEPVSISGRDFRFRLIGAGRSPGVEASGNAAQTPYAYEAVAGMGQFGLTFDDWGRRFVCDNRHHLQLFVMEDRYTRRNPFLAAGSLIDDIPVHGADAQVFPLGSNWTTSNLHSGTFTACCGVHVYRGDLLPPEYRGNAFVCEPPGSLVHRDVLEASGATLKARRGRDGVEFLASTDDWFRPVNLTTGPDGALYVADMYRAIIEHPEWMPQELRGRPELALGRHRGRIYRVVPDAEFGARPLPRLGQAGTAELVELLGHPNAWWRETAQRLLVERQDSDAVPLLKESVMHAPEARARLHAAWTLEGLGALGASLVGRLLRDQEARVREQALVLSEPSLSETPETLWPAVRPMVADDDARVRFQAVLSLGVLPAEFKRVHIGEFTQALGEVAMRDSGDSWTRLAITSAVPEQAGALLARLLAEDGYADANQAMPDRLALIREVAAVVGSRRNGPELEAAMSELLQFDGEKVQWQLALLDGLAAGAGRRGARLADLVQLLPEARRAATTERLQALFAGIASAAVSDNAPMPSRRQAVDLLAHAPSEIAVNTLAGLLGNLSAQPLQRAVIRSLAAQPNDRVAGLILSQWPGATPQLRREIASGLLRNSSGVTALLDQIDSGRVLVSDLSAGEVQRLRNYGHSDLRDRARRLLAGQVPEDRRKVLAQYQGALNQAGEPHRGRTVFEKNCATCHRVAGLGIEVAPDISDARTRTREALLNDILNPNAAIDNNYVQYTVVTVDGRVVTGVIASETASSLTLRRAENETDTVLRQDIDTIASTGKSLMPEGLEKEVSVRDMADLLAFLKNWRYVKTAPTREGEASSTAKTPGS